MADDDNPSPLDRLGVTSASARPPEKGEPSGSRGEPERRLAGLVPFKPGQSGNPSGVSRASREFRDLAKSFAPDALRKLKIIALKGNGMPSVRACEIIIERAFGKAPQPITGENGAPLDLGFGAAAGALIEAAVRARAAEARVTDVAAEPVLPDGSNGSAPEAPELGGMAEVPPEAETSLGDEPVT